MMVIVLLAAVALLVLWIGSDNRLVGLFGSSLGFKAAELFEITNEVEREAPIVDLSRT